jgi:hypothetical protein
LSLNALGLGLLVLALAGLAALPAWRLAPQVLALVSQDRASGPGRQPIARRLITYRLDPLRPTVFRFSQPIAELRMITQPVLSKAAVQPGKHWTYGVRAALLDASGGVIETVTIHARSTILEPDGTRRGPPRYYRGVADMVATGDEFHVRGARPVAAIRVLAGSADPGVVAIDLRVSEQRPLIDSAANSAFARYSPVDRERLAAASAFPPELLTRTERMAIARNQWRPVGPVGIEGRDYVSQVLYEEEESPFPSINRPSAPRAGR